MQEYRQRKLRAATYLQNKLFCFTKVVTYLSIFMFILKYWAGVKILGISYLSTLIKVGELLYACNGVEQCVI